MKIGIDLSRAVNEKAGIARYCQNLVVALSKIDKKNEYCFYYSFWRRDKIKMRQIKKIQALFGKKAETVIRRLPGQIKEKSWGLSKFLPWAEDYRQLDIFHATSILELPLSLDKPTVLTIYDMTTFLFPDQRGKKISEKLSQRTREVMQKASKIIAISENTKRDIQKLCQIPSSKIVVVPLAASEIFKPLPKIKKKKIILTVGTIEPRKNLTKLIQAYLDLPQAIRKKYQLIIVGGSGWNNSEIYNLAQKSSQIKFIGRVKDEKLVRLYNEATVFAYPSLYEGFGLPPLEAMASGTPVLISNISSIPEVTGEAAILVNPKSVDSIKKGLLKILKDPKLQKKLKKAGLKQAKKFSWEKCARETLAVYDKVYKTLGHEIKKTRRPKLALVSDWVRRDLQQPMRYFRKIEIYHFYARAGYQDMTEQDFEGATQYKNIFDLYRKLNSANPDIIQGSEPYASKRALFNSLVVWIYCLIHKKKFFFPMFENRPVMKKFGWIRGFILKIWLRIYANVAKAVIAVNLGAKYSLLEAGVTNEKIKSLLWATWGVDTKEFFDASVGVRHSKSSDKSKNEKVKMKKPTLLFVGRVEEKKGIFDLLEAFARARKMIGDLELWVIGPGEEKIIKQINEQKGAKYFGIIKNRDLPEYFHKAWITIAPSITTRDWEEQVGMVNIQSIACGTPVITTYSGAIPEFIPDQLVGILVPEKKIDQLTQAIAKLVLDDKLRQKMGVAASAYARDHYDAAKNVKKAEQFVLKLLKD